jgi:hypothetical protein
MQRIRLVSGAYIRGGEGRGGLLRTKAWSSVTVGCAWLGATYKSLLVTAVSSLGSYGLGMKW